MRAGRWTRVERPWTAVALPLALVVAILAADVAEGPKTAFVGVLVVAPMLSAVFGTPVTVALVGVLTLTAAGLFGLQADDGQVGAQLTRLAIIAVFTVVAVLVAAARVRGEVALARADRIVNAVTEAIIRPLPARVGGVPVASRYLGADAEAHVGGDFYEVLDTPHGVRVVVGDVRGKGLSAVRMANYVLGAFRDAARREHRLEDVAAALDGMVATEGEDEDFVTALLLEVRDGRVRGVSCGHPQPQCVQDGVFVEADVPVDLPLGLGAGGVAPGALPPGTGAMLLHSDGLTEARSPSGVFLDVPGALAPLAGTHGEQLLAGVVAAVRTHVGGRLRDDVALLWLDVAALPEAPGLAVRPAVRDLLVRQAGGPATLRASTTEDA
ncbi:PP2C family protein-serine/threonine phosphatase [Jannaschia sp. R86511]|uniref:PP2C family protein-serine/threonine phosphatase n=1 Tax=Jannaschia sp. R86511 TaxID=3093853 RepID=UPI0036D394BF